MPKYAPNRRLAMNNRGPSTRKVIAVNIRVIAKKTLCRTSSCSTTLVTKSMYANCEDTNWYKGVVQPANAESCARRPKLTGVAAQCAHCKCHNNHDGPRTHANELEDASGAVGQGCQANTAEQPAIGQEYLVEDHHGLKDNQGTWKFASQGSRVEAENQAKQEKQ
eukprot:CAMPEP_0115482874 /NCGR_PEP_ID=MMETSP0271-20121206/58560_1 /TAXON_ID=71861 /ORGANISM="Scrippsiella trochoidea, Strain CCMP3099" /LENGTH=164 /DNA_ID=CAMNT_0002910697 /DNA_START=577 /DNA_END=1071 /DNA_ORIENTATION=-